MPPAPHDPQDQSSFRAPWNLFWVAFILRLLAVIIGHTYRIHAFDNHFDFGWEAGRIGAALANGFGYSDPFSTPSLPHTGPTAWLPPIYPLLIGGVFRVFGVYSAASAFVLLALNCVFSALTALAIWEIAARCCGLRVARWAAWIWALDPAAMQYAIRWIWETSLTTALFAWLLVLALRMRNITPLGPDPGERTNPSAAHTLRRWALFGIAWGIIALANSTLLLFLPVCGIWLLLDPAQSSRTGLTGAVVATILFLACVAPWTLRNWRAFHAWIPLRGNFGAELYMGDGPGSNGFLRTYEHPHMDLRQLHLYDQLGEVRYVALRGTLAKVYIHQHPAHFVWVVAKRVYFFWAGVPSDQRFLPETGRLLNFEFASVAGLLGLALAIRRRIPAARLLAWAVLLLPVPYYLVTVHARFRHPLEPILCIFGVFLFQSATSRAGEKVDIA